MPRCKKSTPPNTKRQTEAWQMQTARAQFGELFRRACNEGPQVVTHHGKEQVVVLAAEQFARLIKRVRQPESLVRFLAESPLKGVNLDFRRDVNPEQESVAEN